MDGDEYNNETLLYYITDNENKEILNNKISKNDDHILTEMNLNSTEILRFNL
jgi:hypothetical protein